ncbi:MAG: hypothetical protein M3341_07700 [Actinomycetota bacterium]|nr:hypothetical protein [Actinomycetota bacterium]
MARAKWTVLPIRREGTDLVAEVRVGPHEGIGVSVLDVGGSTPGHSVLASKA